VVIGMVSFRPGVVEGLLPRVRPTGHKIVTTLDDDFERGSRKLHLGRMLDESWKFTNVGCELSISVGVG
jgi:hypothetical protein